MVMWKEMPSGREEAIETLVDMDPQGNFYRAARVWVSYLVCSFVCLFQNQNIVLHLRDTCQILTDDNH